MPEAVTSKVKVSFPDGTSRDVPSGTSVDEVLRAAELSLNGVVAAKYNGYLVDLGHRIQDHGTLVPVSVSEAEGLEILRHSASHIMAHAVKDLFPQALPTIGPPTSEGFYYDFYYPQRFTEDDLVKIESRMKEIIDQGNAFTREVLPREEAIALFTRLGEKFKVEILREIADSAVSIYREGGFVDLCRGPHLPSTRRLPAVKLLSIAGSYWRGDETQPMLQRIYGTAFPSVDELTGHLERLEEAKKRDHRRLGKELDLFSMSDGVGPGFILWHPKGALVRSIIEDFWRTEHKKNGYELIYSPHMARLDLWRRSGHMDFYRENMYSPLDVDDIEYQIKPMNCPFHIMIYKSRIRSYRELPLRWAELGTVYRYERSGVLHGLLRVRGFTQDDAHIFLRPDQVEEEVLKVLDLTVKFLGTFGFHDYQIRLSTRPEKYVGSPEGWELATKALERSLAAKELPFEIAPGEGAFYGPKIDLEIKDVLGRAWQCTTVQVDFNLPERFDMTYTGEDNALHRPMMVHRAILGSLERFFGILIEHYGGAFPLWLAPVQVLVIAMNDEVTGYADSVARSIEEAGLRTEKDYRAGTLGHKIREATLKKVPYMAIIGKKEQGAGTLSVRTRDGQERSGVTIEDFTGHLLAEVRARETSSTLGEGATRRERAAVAMPPRKAEGISAKKRN